MYNITIGRFEADPEAQGVVRPAEALPTGCVSIIEAFIVGAALYAWNGEQRRIRVAMSNRAIYACYHFFDRYGIDCDASRALGGLP